MSKNIEINVKTENGYEVLYPKINAQTSVDILNDYNKYWWRKETNTDTYEIEQTLNSTSTMILCNSSYYGSTYLYYADEIEIVDDVQKYIKLKGQINSIQTSITNSTNVLELFAPAIGKYCAFCGYQIYTGGINEYDYKKVDKNLLLTPQTEFSRDYNSSTYGGYAAKARNYYVLSIKTNYNSPNIEYIQSENANAYPVSFDELYSVVPDKLYEGQEFGLRDMSSSNDYLYTDISLITDGIKYDFNYYSQSIINIGTQYDGYMSENEIQIIKGRYVQGGEDYSGFISTGTYYIPNDAIVKWGYINSGSSLRSIIVNKYYTVKIIKNNSPHYTSLGNILEKFKTCPNYEYGNYIGSGTWLVNLKFSFVPKIVFLFKNGVSLISNSENKNPELYCQGTGLTNSEEMVFVNSLNGFYAMKVGYHFYATTSGSGIIRAFFKEKELQVMTEKFKDTAPITIKLFNETNIKYGYIAFG